MPGKVVKCTSGYVSEGLSRDGWLVGQQTECGRPALSVGGVTQQVNGSDGIKSGKRRKLACTRFNFLTLAQLYSFFATGITCEH